MGPMEKVRVLKANFCFTPLHYKYNAFFREGECSETCGKGWQLFSRECNYPEPQNDGKQCEGNFQEYRQCNNRSCNMHIHKYEWKIRWTECIHGAAYKIVECVNDKNEVVQHSYCSYPKPNNNSDIRSCRNGQYDFKLVISISMIQNSFNSMIFSIVGKLNQNHHVQLNVDMDTDTCFIIAYKDF